MYIFKKNFINLKLIKIKIKINIVKFNLNN